MKKTFEQKASILKGDHLDGTGIAYSQSKNSSASVKTAIPPSTNSGFVVGRSSLGNGRSSKLPGCQSNPSTLTRPGSPSTSGASTKPTASLKQPSSSRTALPGYSSLRKENRQAITPVHRDSRMLKPTAAKDKQPNLVKHETKLDDACIVKNEKLKSQIFCNLYAVSRVHATSYRDIVEIHLRLKSEHSLIDKHCVPVKEMEIKGKYPVDPQSRIDCYLEDIPSKFKVCISNLSIYRFFASLLMGIVTRLSFTYFTSWIYFKKLTSCLHTC
uniref:Uncharacterized protein n=1 Tax=Romanomermis culicivorax TaxID=13658 RepID=A0A915JRK6_ROMCU